MKYLYCWLVALLPITLCAQDFNSGLLLNDDQETPVLADFGAKFDAVKQIKVDLKPYAPIPQDQGELPSCVGWSVGYGALTIMAAQQQKWVNDNFITGQAFSPHFIYNQLVEDKNCMYAGASFPSAFKLLERQGICKKKTFNVDNEECSVLPNASLKQEAKENRIKGYYQLFMKDASTPMKIRKIKKSLAEGFPVVVGMFLTPDFRRIRKGDQYWSPKATPKNQLYPHAMVVVGYNDIKKSFELMNSWGDQWGNKGFIWVKYDDFAKHCVLAYQLQLPDGEEILMDVEERKPRDPFEPFVEDVSDVKHKASKSGNKKNRPKTIELHGDFTFQYPTDMDGDKVLFEKAGVELVGNHYSLMKKDWELGQMFQLIAHKIKKNRFVYVFSLDGEDNVSLHWPKDLQRKTKDVKKQKFGYTESPLIAYKNAKIIIPSENSGLQKQVEGDDYLFVLYSYNVIEDIDQVMETIQNSSSPMEKRLEEALGDDLIPYDQVEFSKTKISAKTNASNGTVLGVMIESKGE